MRKLALIFSAILISGAANAAPDSAQTTASKKATDQMHEKMMIEYSGDADIDFARGMIPHHEGAVEMAKIELQYGKDPELKKLAKAIIAAQEKEIKFLQNWRARNDD